MPASARSRCVGVQEVRLRDLFGLETLATDR
jgi:hypothetical protein